jgi:hypothetical protein
MKVKTAIEWLSELDQESEIVIGWWDKYTAESYVDGLLTDDQWSDIVFSVGDEPLGFEQVGELITELASDFALAPIEG